MRKTKWHIQIYQPVAGIGVQASPIDSLLFYRTCDAGHLFDVYEDAMSEAEHLGVQFGTDAIEAALLADYEAEPCPTCAVDAVTEMDAPEFDEFRLGYSDAAAAWADANPEIIAAVMPACMLCRQSDRMTPMPPMRTDFGGILHTALCRRCGVLALIPEGERP